MESTKAAVNSSESIVIIIANDTTVQRGRPTAYKGTLGNQEVDK